MDGHIIPMVKEVVSKANPCCKKSESSDGNIPMRGVNPQNSGVPGSVDWQVFNSLRSFDLGAIDHFEPDSQIGGYHWYQGGWVRFALRDSYDWTRPFAISIPGTDVEFNDSMLNELEQARFAKSFKVKGQSAREPLEVLCSGWKEEAVIFRGRTIRLP